MCEMSDDQARFDLLSLSTVLPYLRWFMLSPRI